MEKTPEKTFAEPIIHIIRQFTNVQTEEIGLSGSLIGEMNDMESGANILSYIVRVWLEELTSEEDPIIWRGHITPVPNGKRRYFSDINDIPDLIAAHVKAQR